MIGDTTAGNDLASILIKRLGTEKPQRAKGLIMFCLADKADMNISAIIHKTDHRRQKPLKRQPRIEDLFGDEKTSPAFFFGGGGERERLGSD